MALNSPGGSTTRLWRARRRRDRIDAELRRAGSGWELQFIRNDRLLLTWRYPRQEPARSAAAARLRDLERAGWITHW